MPSPTVWNPCISPPILLDSHIEVGQSGRETIEGYRREDSQGMESPGDETRPSNDGAKCWVDKAPRDGIPKMDKLIPLHSRDPPPFLLNNTIFVSKEDPQY
jgi:hypothetical protein